MVSYKTKRKWHKWPGIIFLLPSFIISVTAVLLALNGVLHLDRITLNLPTVSKHTGSFEVKSMMIAGERIYAGTKQGLYVYENENFTAISGMEGYDIRGLVPKGDSLLAASKQGLWLIDGIKAHRILKQEVFGVSELTRDKLLVSLGKKGYMIVNYDGTEVNAREHIPESYHKSITSLETSHPYTLHKLVVDLHTGEALVGRALKPWYIALTGLQMLILTLTGLLMLFKKKSRNKVMKVSSQTG